MIAYAFSTEDRILLCCARRDLAPHDCNRLLALTEGPVDWQAVVREALRQCIVPLVYRHLNAEVADRVPQPILERLRDAYLEAASRSMALAAELRALTQLLGANGIDALPYKGPVLALQAYGDIALRTFTDLDILVPREQVPRARELLAARGYVTLDALTAAQEQAILRLDHNLPLLRAADDILVELHWRVAPASFTFAMPMEDLWARAGHVDLAGAPVRAMAIEDLMIILPVHGSRHAWGAVEWITGIAELMRGRASIDWDEVMARAAAYRVARTVRLALALANRLLDAPLPEAVERWIERDRTIPGLVEWVAARLFMPVDKTSGMQQLALFRFEMAVKDRSVERVRDAVSRVTFPTGKDWEAARLPDALFPFYFAIRPVRLLGRYLRHRAFRR